MKLYCLMDANDRIVGYSFEKFANAIEVETDSEPKVNYDKIIDGEFVKATEQDVQNYNNSRKEMVLHQQKIAKLEAELVELDYDINACEDGDIKKKTVSEYRAERSAKRGELKALKDEEPREVKQNDIQAD